MNTLIARHTIILTVAPGKAADPKAGTPAVRPVTKTITPGTYFIAQSEEQERELTSGVSPAAHVVENPNAPVVETVGTDDSTPAEGTKRRAAGGRKPKAAAPAAPASGSDDGSDLV